MSFLLYNWQPNKENTIKFQMAFFPLIFDEIQIWGNKKGMRTSTMTKKNHNSDKIHICIWRGQVLLQFRFKDSKHLKPTRQRWSKDCAISGWLMGKPSYLGLSRLSSFPLGTFQMSSLYLNSLAMSVNTSTMAALRSILQVIS